ncbi:MAG: hypothetical protein ABJD11_03850 [Gemmatimonadota bacterium]
MTIESARQRIAALWERAAFAAEPAVNLAMARIVVGLHTLWILLSRDPSAMSGTPTEFWRGVSASARLRYLIFPQMTALEPVIQGAVVIALILLILGVAARPAGLIAAVGIYHLAPLETLIWTASPYARGLTLAPLMLVVLAVSPCDRALSPGSRGQRDTHASWEYGWPLRLMQLWVAQIYLFSLIGKLLRTGWTWGSAEHMRDWFLWFNQDPQVAVFSTMGLWLADHPVLCALIGVTTMALEAVFVAAVFSPRARRWLVPVALAFHVGILLTLNVHVAETWLLLIFTNWGWVYAQIQRRSASQTLDTRPA